MAITSAVCNSFKSELLAGTHAAADVYKMALFTSSATLNKSTTAYSTTNEVTGTGYTAGGVTLAGYTPGSGSDVAWLDWTTDPNWPSSSITARGALIYNSSKSNKAVAVLDFGSDIVSSSSTFTVTLPTADATNAIVRVGP